MKCSKVAYQNILKLSYIDKLLSDIQLEFRDKYKNDLQNMNYSRSFNDFKLNYDQILKECELGAKFEASKQKQPRSYHETEKANSKVSTMIEKKTNILPLGFLNTPAATQTKPCGDATNRKEPVVVAKPETSEDIKQIDVNANLEKLKMKRFDKSAKGKKEVKKVDDVASPKKGKKPTNWDGGIVHAELDYSNGTHDPGADDAKSAVDIEKYADKDIVGGMKGELRGKGLGFRMFGSFEG